VAEVPVEPAIDDLGADDELDGSGHFGVATARLAKKVARRNLMRVLMEDMVLSVEVLVVVEIEWLDDRFEK
jgi:hypothetical protein